MNAVEKLTVPLDLPRDLLSALDVPQTALAYRLRELIALELFREGCISTGKGAELLEMTKPEFVRLLAQRGIAYFTESPEELASDVAALEDLLPPEER